MKRLKTASKKVIESSTSNGINADQLIDELTKKTRNDKDILKNVKK